MPIWLRKFTFLEISNHYNERNAAQEKALQSNNKANTKTLVDTDGKVNVADFKAASKQYTKTGYK